MKNVRMVGNRDFLKYLNQLAETPILHKPKAREDVKFSAALLEDIYQSRKKQIEAKKPKYTINFGRSGLVETIAPDDRPYYNRLRELGLIFNTKQEAYAVAKSAVTLAQTLQEHIEHE